MNIQKGIDYEKFIKSDLLTEYAKNGQVWLWDEIPEFELRKAGMLGDWNEHRLTKKDNKINGLPDLGTDILLKIKVNENDFNPIPNNPPKRAYYKKTIKLNLIIFNNNLLLKIYILFLNTL
jgi:hypothetical protein